MQASTKGETVKVSQKPMSYSDSVKQAAKPRTGGDTEASRNALAKEKRREQAQFIENFQKERDKLKKSLEIMKREYNRLKANCDEMVARKRDIIAEKDRLIDELLHMDRINSDGGNDKCKIDQEGRNNSAKRLNDLKRSISRKIVMTKLSVLEIKNNYFMMKEKNERQRDLINLLTTDWSRDERKNGRRRLEDLYIGKKEEFERLQKELKDAEMESSGDTKQEDFMKKRIKLLTEQVESRVTDVSKINERLYESETNYEEKCILLDNLQEQGKEIRKELSEPILNRRQFNLCLKENLSYDGRLREILEERERIQYEYGAMMEDIKVMRVQFDIEEKAKEKLFMSIMTLLDEGQQFRAESENMLARISQMHSEIFVRHGFMHAKETSIDDLTEQCNGLEERMHAATEKELSLKCRNAELQRKLTEILFDVCFGISLKAVGNEKEHDSAFDDDDDSCEVVDLDELEMQNKKSQPI